MAGAELQEGVGAQRWELVPSPGSAEVSSWQQELGSPSWHLQLLPPEPVPEKDVTPGHIWDMQLCRRDSGVAL